MNDQIDANEVVRHLAEQNAQLNVELAIAKATISSLRASKPADE